MPKIDPSLEQEILRRMARFQSQRYSEFEPSVLAWLALSPGWTKELAEYCRFPIRSESLSSFLDRAEAAGLLRQEFTGNRLDFWMPSGERAQVLDWLRRRLDPPALMKYAVEIGQAMDQILPPDEYASPFRDEITSLRKRATAFMRDVTNRAGSPTEIDVPENIARWARMASMLLDTNRAADWLDNRIITHLDAGQTGEVIAWLEMARFLSELTGGRLEDTVRLGNRRLELIYRRAMESRQLADFQRRPAQLRPFYYLLENQDDVWALHYMGMGGVGKTMLLRFISAGCPQADPEPPLDYISCRVDFDYIKTEFPYKKPGQLLLELAAELRLHGASVTSLRSFHTEAESLHRILDSRPGNYDLAKLVEQDPEFALAFKRMLTSFYTMIRDASGLGSGPIIVLVLDTCEELAKVPSMDRRLVAVEATFYILERLRALHDELYPDTPLPFRVIFSGRRPLAKGGERWEILPGQALGHRQLLPEGKTYLILHELRGFSHDDLRQYFCHRKVPTISSAAYKAILRASRETGRPAMVTEQQWNEPHRLYRYNPFDLDLFADWLLNDPQISAQQIASGNEDPYVHFRILDRLGRSSLVALLPYLVLLERLDESLLELLLEDIDERDCEALFRELSDQEWIDYRTTDELQKTFLEVDSNLLPRLRRYYGIDRISSGSAGPVPVPTIPITRIEMVLHARKRLGEILEKLISDGDGRGRSLSQLSPRYIDAALRILPAEAGDRLWEVIERRIPSELGWASAVRFLEPILANEDGSAMEEHPLWAAVQATRASVHLHTRPGVDRSGFWKEILETVELEPHGPSSQRLSKRARLGRLAALPWNQNIIPEQDQAMEVLGLALESLELLEPLVGDDAAIGTPKSLSTIPDETQQMAAAACAALGNLLDLIERAMQDGQSVRISLRTNAATSMQDELPTFEWSLSLVVDPSRLDMLASRLHQHRTRSRSQEFDPGLLSYALALIGRIYLLAGDRQSAWRVLREAAWLAPLPGDSAGPDAWLDWIPPADLPSRLRLWALQALPIELSLADEDDLLTWRSNAFPSDGSWNADRERLVSATLMAELARRLVQKGILDDVRKRWGGDVYAPECLVHARTPPLLLALARAGLALGFGDWALSLLEGPAGSAQNMFLLQAARQGLLEGLRRMRIYTTSAWVSEWVEGREFARAELAWPAAYLSGQRGLQELQQLTPIDPGMNWLNLWNSLQPRPEGLNIGSFSFDTGDNKWGQLNPGWNFDTACLFLQAREVEGARPEISNYGIRFWLERRPFQAEYALRLSIRAYCLDMTHGRFPDVEDLKEDGQAPLPEDALEDWRELAGRIPVRRRGEILLEEGELIAHRSPSASTRVLQMAHTEFRQAGDAFGALQSGICAALARLHAMGANPEVDEQQERSLREDYEACRELRPELPEWNALLEAGSAGFESFNQISAGMTIWRGWFGFLLAVYLIPRPDGKARLTTLIGPQTVNPPPDIAFASESPAESPAGCLTVSLRRFFYALGVGIFLAMMVGAFYMVYQVYVVFERALVMLGISRMLPAWWSRVGLFIFVLYVLVSGTIIGWRKLITPRRMGLSIEGRSGGEKRFALSRSVRKFRFGWPMLLWQESSWSWRSDFTALPKETPPVSFTMALNYLKSLAGRNDLKNLPFSIATQDREDQEVLWEQDWARQLNERDPMTPLRRLGMYRLVDGSQRELLAPGAGWDLGLVRLVCTTTAEDLLRKAWQGLSAGFVHTDTLPTDTFFDTGFRQPTTGSLNNLTRRDYKRMVLRDILLDQLYPEELYSAMDGPRQEASGTSTKRLMDEGSVQKMIDRQWVYQLNWAKVLERTIALRPDIQSPYRVLHLVGTPAQTNYGLGWQIASSLEVEETYQQKSFGGINTISAEEVPGWLTPLVILQGEPSNEPLLSLADEMRARDMRSFASTLIAAGAPAVIVLPPLPFEWTTPVVRELARALAGRRPPNLRRMLKAVAAARKAIQKQPLNAPRPGELQLKMAVRSPGTAGERDQLAMQVCLFWRRPITDLWEDLSSSSSLPE